MTAPRRPALRYHGGKWKLARHILTAFPPHRIYTEVFGGGASVLLQKPRSYAEVYNDLDGEVVNVFRVLQSPGMAAHLHSLMQVTPYARAEFELAYQPADDPVERARRTIIKSFMGYGSPAIHDQRPAGMRTSSSKWRPPTGFRPNSNRSGSTPAHDWATWPQQIAAFTERLRGVVIENRDACAILGQHDVAGEALHYVDPPYLHETRSGMRGRGAGSRHGYTHEMTDADHRRLLDCLTSLRGGVVLSAYDAPLYRRALTGWRRLSMLTRADQAKPRTEVLWLNPQCRAMIAADIADAAAQWRRP